MVYQQSEIARDVRIALDQNSVSTQLTEIDDIDTLSLDELIINKIPDAVRMVEMQAPLHLLDSGNNFGSSISWSEEQNTSLAASSSENVYVGWTLLPEDFMRLIVFKMSDWERPVYTAMMHNDPHYPHQSSRYAGIVGTPQKPECAIVMRPEGRVLEFWSCTSNSATVEHAVYLPLPEWDDDGGITICERCYRPAVYYTAAIVSRALGNADMATLLIGTADTMLV